MSCAHHPDATESSPEAGRPIPHLFNLPLEIRQEIYSYVYKPTQVIHVSVCKSALRNVENPAYCHRRRAHQPLADQTVALEDLTKLHQPQLYEVCQHICDDLRDHLSRLKVEFHCLDCFDLFLQHLTFNTQTGPSWMQHILIHVNVNDRTLSRRLGTCHRTIQGPPIERNIQALHASTLKEAIQVARRTARLYLSTRSLPAISTTKGPRRTSARSSLDPAPVMDIWDWSYVPISGSDTNQKGADVARVLNGTYVNPCDGNEWIVIGKLRHQTSELQAHL